MKLAVPRFSLPKPTFWDLTAVAVVVAGCVLAGFNWSTAGSTGAGTALPTATAFLFVLAQLATSALSLTLLGKTASGGTAIGILAAVAGTLVGISGSLLAAVLWAAA